MTRGKTGGLVAVFMLFRSILAIFGGLFHGFRPFMVCFLDL